MRLHRLPRRGAAALAVFTSTLAAIDGCASARPGATAAAFASPPASGWLQYAAPESAGFSSAALEKAFRYADSVRSGAVMVVYRGAVVAAWGDVSRKLELHSVRKSFVSALFGMAADRGAISLDATLGELGITDRTPLSDAERSARVRDLLAARSGVYLPAAYADASQDRERPPRGSHAPNTFWFYNNWDFNTLGTIYEKAVEPSLYEALDRRLARPIGMQDYSPADGFLVYEPGSSIHPAHTIRMSTRDLARFGQLFLQHGAWDGTQVISREWIAKSTTPRSETGVTNRGYAYLWWTQAAGPVARYPEVDKRKLFYGSGTGGQLVLVIPSDDIVIVHRGDTDHGRSIPGRDAWRIVELILEAHTGDKVAQGGMKPLSPVALASQLPPVVAPTYVPLDAELIAQLSGQYEIAPNVFLRVFAFNGRLFGSLPGQGEAELFGLSRSEFTIRIMPGVRFAFERNAQGDVTGVAGTIGPQQFRGVKRR
jgi:CubicO group peptidase (beta-lactamase class C family)